MQSDTPYGDYPPELQARIRRLDAKFRRIQCRMKDTRQDYNAGLQDLMHRHAEELPTNLKNSKRIVEIVV